MKKERSNKTIIHEKKMRLLQFNNSLCCVHTVNERIEHATLIFEEKKKTTTAFDKNLTAKTIFNKYDTIKRGWE